MFPGATLLSVGLLTLPLPAADLPRLAAAKAMPLLVKAAQGHIDQRSCFACHNQVFPMMAFALARERGFDLPDDLVKAQTDHIADFLHANIDRFRKGQGTGGQVDTAGYALLTLELGGYKPDEATEAVVEYLLKRHADRNHWQTTSNRPPTEASSFTTTYLGLRALRFWAKKEQKEKAEKRIAEVRDWVIKTRSKDTEDRVFRLLSLKEIKADDRDLAAAAWDLLRRQRPDGGWSQLDSMTSDAYATATALVALHQAAGLPTDHPAYSRGLAYLLKSQRPDGSWYVKSRSKPFQPYYESGFPHGKDQFISAATSGWATTALLLASEKK